MSTRATIQIINNNELVLSEYIGMDGFPTKGEIYGFILSLKKTDMRIWKSKLIPTLFERCWTDSGEDAHSVYEIEKFALGKMPKEEVEEWFSDKTLYLYDPSDNLIDWAVVLNLDSSKLYIGDTCFDSKTPFETTLEELQKEKWFYLSKLPGYPTLQKLEDDAYGDDE